MTRVAPDASGGFVYAEVLLAVMIVALAVSGMALVLEQSRRVTTDGAAIDTAAYLLQDGVAWVRLLARSDPQTPSSFGREVNEPTIADIDDVDDLDGLAESPVVDRAGTAAGSEWRRTWTVTSVSLTDPRIAAAPGATALLRVRIGVLRQGDELASQVLLIWRKQ